MNIYISFLFFLLLTAGVYRPISGQTLQSTSSVPLASTYFKPHRNPDYSADSNDQTDRNGRKIVGNNLEIQAVFSASTSRKKRTRQDNVYAKSFEQYPSNSASFPTGRGDQVMLLPDGRWVIVRPEATKLSNGWVFVPTGYEPFYTIPR